MIRLAVVLLVLHPGARIAETPPPPTEPAAFKVARTIAFSLGHALGAAEAKSRTTATFAALQAKYGGKVTASTITWAGDDASVRVTAYGQVTTADVHVRDTTWTVKVNLPFLLSPLAGTVETTLRNTAVDALK